jgi:PAS domain S-box-containing protein
VSEERQSKHVASDAVTLANFERALRDGRLLLASVLENLPLGVGVYDDAGNLTLANQCLRNFGYLDRLPSREQAEMRRWRAFDTDGQLVKPSDYPGARALRGETVMPGTDFLYNPGDGPGRWMRISAVPFQREGAEHAEAIVVVQDVDDLKRAGEKIEAAAADLARQARFVEATLSSIPDYVYAFDANRRFAYANPVMLGLFGLASKDLLGRTFADLDYPPDLAAHLNRDIDRVFRDGVTIEDEVFYESPTGHAAFFSYLWGPVRNDNGAVELVVGVSRDTSERRAFEEEVRRNEARLRAATELANLGIYAWDPATGALDWDDRVRAMWGLPPGAPVDMSVYEAGIHPDDLPRVREAIAACVDPSGDGRYSIEYRVIGRDDGVLRHIATSGRTSFEHGRPTAFIGATVDVSEQRRNEAAVRSSEAQFRSFAENSSNLLWIVDPAAGKIIYRSAAFERIWGIPPDDAPVMLEAWMENVHADDRLAVARALDTVKAGEVAQYEYRIVRPKDGAVRWLRDTSFPIRDDHGAIQRIGGIIEDLTQADSRQVYIVCAIPSEARRLARLVRATDYRARIFESASAFLDIAPVLAPGCVLLDLRKARSEGLSIPRELKARSIALPAIALDDPNPHADTVVAAMKAGAIDYLLSDEDTVLQDRLALALAECHATAGPPTRSQEVSAQIARLTPREREVLVGLINGGTNKVIAQSLGISPRTVELHRSQVMSKLGSGSLTQLIQIALAAGLSPTRADAKAPKRT